MKAPLLLLECRLRVIRRRIERLFAEHSAAWEGMRSPSVEVDAHYRKAIREACARQEFFAAIHLVFYRLAWEGGGR